MKNVRPPIIRLGELKPGAKFVPVPNKTKRVPASWVLYQKLYVPVRIHTRQGIKVVTSVQCVDGAPYCIEPDQPVIPITA